VLSFRATGTIFIGTRTQDIFRVCDLSSCNLLAETNKFCLGAFFFSCFVYGLQKSSSSGFEPRTVFGVVIFVHVISLPIQTTLVMAPFFIVLSLRAIENFFAGNRTQGSFRGCNLCLCNILFETNKFVPGAVLLSCLVSELQKPSSSGIELSTASRYSDLRFFNFLFDATALVFSPFFCRGSFLSYRNRPRRESNSGHFIRRFNPPVFSSWSRGISMPGSGENLFANLFFRSRAISEQTNIQTHRPKYTHSFSFIYKIVIH
jgi:hypothetical protein